VDEDEDEAVVSALVESALDAAAASGADEDGEEAGAAAAPSSSSTRQPAHTQGDVFVFGPKMQPTPLRCTLADRTGPDGEPMGVWSAVLQPTKTIPTLTKPVSLGASTDIREAALIADMPFAWHGVRLEEHTDKRAPALNCPQDFDRLLSLCAWLRSSPEGSSVSSAKAAIAVLRQPNMPGLFGSPPAGAAASGGSSSSGEGAAGAGTAEAPTDHAAVASEAAPPTADGSSSAPGRGRKQSVGRARLEELARESAATAIAAAASARKQPCAGADDAVLPSSSSAAGGSAAGAATDASTSAAPGPAAHSRSKPQKDSSSSRKSGATQSLSSASPAAPLASVSTLGQVKAGGGSGKASTSPVPLSGGVARASLFVSVPDVSSLAFPQAVQSARNALGQPPALVQLYSRARAAEVNPRMLDGEDAVAELVDLLGDLGADLARAGRTDLARFDPLLAALTRKLQQWVAHLRETA
jgi:hypothetical protein